MISTYSIDPTGHMRADAVTLARCDSLPFHAAAKANIKLKVVLDSDLWDAHPHQHHDEREEAKQDTDNNPWQFPPRLHFRSPS